jgi:hypothetical protein
MGLKGDLLELIDRAPVGLHTLSGSLWRWTHNPRARQAFDELSRRANAAVTHVGDGHVDGETTDEHLQVWLGPLDRWRIESEDRIDLRDGATRWTGRTTLVNESDHDRSTLDATEVGVLVHPGAHLFGVLRFEAPVDDVVAGRRCWKALATTDPGCHSFRPVPFGLRLAGIEHTFWFDRETGIVLRHLGSVDSRPCSMVEFKEVWVNPFIEEDIFEFEPATGTLVHRRTDHLIRMAERAGADLSGVDRTDARAILAALSDTRRHPPVTAEALLERERAEHIPLGDPPVDEPASRAAVEYAFSHIDEVDTTATGLVNVQGGGGLARALEEARRAVAGGPATLLVESVKFLRADEAVVWFSVAVDERRLEAASRLRGRAVRLGSAWMVEHATFADLVRPTGVEVPPPEDAERS